jgi:hypothetical protein
MQQRRSNYEVKRVERQSQRENKLKGIRQKKFEEELVN